jgi:hypothetical protein
VQQFADAPITIVRQYTDGHHTVRAATPAEALALLTELEQGLAQLGQPTTLAPWTYPRSEPVPVRQASEPPPPELTECPEHQVGKQSKWGGFYCPTELDNGKFCKWTSRPKKSAA